MDMESVEDGFVQGVNVGDALDSGQRARELHRDVVDRHVVLVNPARIIPDASWSEKRLE